jgi:hypothetical protein
LTAPSGMPEALWDTDTLSLLYHSGDTTPMARTHVKVTATVPGTLLAQLDALVTAHAYPSRSAAIEAALTTLLRARMDAHMALTCTGHSLQ